MKTIISVLIGVIGLVASAWIVAHPSAAPEEKKVGGAFFNTNYDVAGATVTTRQSVALKAATSTVCAIQSPAATSTLTFMGVRIDNASTTATLWDVAKATTAFATTTTLGTAAFAVPANGQAYISATTTAPTAILAPNTWVNVGVRAGITGGDTAGTGFVPTGACTAVFVASQF